MEKNTVTLDSVVVVIPYFNGSQTIERALESIKIQTVRPSEVIVVDDGSTKEESEKLEQIGSNFSIMIIKQPNGGQGSARNTGVFQSTANFICFLDQDDFFTHDHIEILLGAIPKNREKFGWAYGDLAEADFNGNIIRSRMIKDHSIHPKTHITNMIGSDMFVLPSASIVCRKAFLAIGGFDKQFTGYEDDDLFIRLFRKGFRNYFVDEPITIWCIHSASTSYSFRMTRSRFRYFIKVSETFPNDIYRNVFYTRDLLIPRFHKIFFSEVRRCVFKGVFKTHRAELFDLYLSFSRIALNCNYKSKKFRLKITLRHLFVLIAREIFRYSDKRSMKNLKGFRKIYLFAKKGAKNKNNSCV